MENRLKIGIVGVGGIAQERHIPNFQNLNEVCQITAVYDIDYEKAKSVAKRFSIPMPFKSYSKLLENVDAVIICTPNKFHANLSVKALNSDVHVMCEKPMAMNTKECNEMISASKKNNKILTIAYHYRFTDVAATAKSAIENGEIGEALVTRIQALRRRKVPGWGVFTNKDLQGGGSLIDYGCHLLDLALWLIGDKYKPKEVVGKTYNKLSKQPYQINEWGNFDNSNFDVDDHVVAFIAFSNNLSMQFECSWAANIKEDEMKCSISGDKGGINLYPFEIYQPKYGSFFINRTEVRHDERIASRRQAINFINSCLGYEQPLVKAEEARNVNLMIESIYESDKLEQSFKF